MGWMGPPPGTPIGFPGGRVGCRGCAGVALTIINGGGYWV